MSSSVSKTLYVRGVPDRLLRQAKALAARRGATLTQVVLEALENTVGDAGESEPEDAGDLGALDADMAWYEDNKRRLVERYRGQYVAVVKGRVADHDADFGALAGRVFRRFGARPVFVPRCMPGERTVNLRSPRVERR
jgi:hypothetical protein